MPTSSVTTNDDRPARARARFASKTTDAAEEVLRVPFAYYRDAAVHERDRRLLATTPLALAASCEIAAPNDYLVRTVLDTAVLLTRDAEGHAHAFLDYCRHRGATPATGSGNTRRFTCPFHGWTYDTRGQLVGVPSPESFEGIERGDYGLVELPSEERHGLVWVVLSAGASIEVAVHLGGYDDELASWDLASHHSLISREFTAPVNWKAAQEVLVENYHFPYVHAAPSERKAPGMVLFDAYGRNHRLSYATSREPTVDDFIRVSWVFPNLTLTDTPIGVDLTEILPGAGSFDCVVRQTWIVRNAPVDDAERAAYEAQFERIHHALHDQDFGVLPGVGRAIRHAQHEHMLIGRNEVAVQHMVRTLADAAHVPL